MYCTLYLYSNLVLLIVLLFFKRLTVTIAVFCMYYVYTGERGSTVVKVLCYKSVGRWFDPSWCQWGWGSTQPLTEMSTRSISWE